MTPKEFETYLETKIFNPMTEQEVLNIVADWLEDEDIQFPQNKEEWKPTIEAFKRAAAAIREGKMLTPYTYD